MFLLKMNNKDVNDMRGTGERNYQCNSEKQRNQEVRMSRSGQGQVLDISTDVPVFLKCCTRHQIWYVLLDDQWEFG